MASVVRHVAARAHRLLVPRVARHVVPRARRHLMPGMRRRRGHAGRLRRALVQYDGDRRWRRSSRARIRWMVRRQGRQNVRGASRGDTHHGASHRNEPDPSSALRPLDGGTDFYRPSVVPRTVISCHGDGLLPRRARRSLVALPRQTRSTHAASHRRRRRSHGGRITVVGTRGHRGWRRRPPRRPRRACRWLPDGGDAGGQGRSRSTISPSLATAAFQPSSRAKAVASERAGAASPCTT